MPLLSVSVGRVSAAAWLVLMATSLSLAQDLYLTSSYAWPGVLWRSVDGGAEREVHRRAPEALVSAPGMVQRLASVAVDREGKQYFVSGLDGYLFHNLGGHDVVSLQGQGQIRDVACTAEEHIVYFSVVPTPRDGEPLADGKIYRYDLYEARPVEVATVRQAEVGGDWWGTFAIRDGVIYVATLNAPSRIYKLPGGSPELVHTANGFGITGFSFAADGEIFFAAGVEKVYRTRDFGNVDVAMRAGRRITDVTLKPSL